MIEQELAARLLARQAAEDRARSATASICNELREDADFIEANRISLVLANEAIRQFKVDEFATAMTALALTTWRLVDALTSTPEHAKALFDVLHMIEHSLKSPPGDLPSNN